MVQDRAGKIALITGGSRGLGRDSALSLARDGVDIIVTYNIGESEANAVVAEIAALGVRAAAVQLDQSRVHAHDDFVARVTTVLARVFDAERIDFLVNSAGVARAIPIDEVTEADFDAFAGINFKGVFFLTQRLLRIMNDNGAVIFLTAAADRYRVPGYSLYASCKGAVEVFSRYVAAEYGSRGIRSNTIAPGAVMTDFAGGFIRSRPEFQKMLVEHTPMGRLATPNDIGAMLALLCQDGSRWMTGQRLEVTGGYGL